MASTAEINARLDAVQNSVDGSLQKSYHGIAARIDRLPAGRAQRTVLWLAGGVCFCDSIDMNIGGPIIAQFLTTGFSDAGANALFVSITALGYLVGGLVSGIISDGFGRKKAILTFASIFTVFAVVASACPDMNTLTVCRFFMGLGLGATYPCGYGAMSEFTPTAKRGRYQAWVGLIANSGSPTSAFLCAVLLPVIGWRNMFLVAAGLGLAVILAIIKFFPESPRWLAQHGRLHRRCLLWCSRVYRRRPQPSHHSYPPSALPAWQRPQHRPGWWAHPSLNYFLPRPRNFHLL